MKKLIPILLLLFFAGTAFAQQHTVIQHGKEWVCPIPKQEPVKAAADTTPGAILIPTVWCVENPLIYHLEEFEGTDFQLMLFDRWGNLIAQSNDPQQSLDEMYRGKKNSHPDIYDVYIYWIRYTVKGEKKELRGHVTLSYNCNCG